MSIQPASFKVGKSLSFYAINSFLDNVPDIQDKVDDVVACITNSTRLRHVVVNQKLHIEDSSMRKNLLEALFMNPNVTEIDIYFTAGNSEVHSGEISELCQALQVNKSLKEFNFWFEHESARVIVEAVASSLSFQSSLESIILCDNDSNVSFRVYEPILSALATNKTPVKKLTLEGLLGLLGEGLESMRDLLARFLQKNDTLRELTVRSRSDPYVLDVAPLLHSMNGHESLKLLRLSGFHFGTLDYPVTLNNVKKLDLSYNKIDIEGAMSIGRPFLGATALEDVDFSHCNIGDDGCMRICEALMQNEAIKSLNFAGNHDITDVGVDALIECVKTHPALTVVYVDASDAAKAKLQYHVDLNKGPKNLLHASVPLPPSLWPQAFKRADNCRRRQENGTVSLTAPDMLYFLVKEKADLLA